MTEQKFREPTTIELVGGPCDGESIDWPGGIYAVVRRFEDDRLAHYEYSYECLREGDEVTIRTAHYVGPWNVLKHREGEPN